MTDNPQLTLEQSTRTEGNISDALVGHYNFKIKEVIKEAWHKTDGVKASYWGGIFIFLLSFAILFAVIILPGTHFISNPEAHHWFLQITNRIIYIALIPMLAGIMMIGIHRAADLPFKATFVYNYYRFFVRLFLGVLITQVIFFVLSALAAAFSISSIMVLHSAELHAVLAFIIGILLFLLFLGFMALLIYLSIAYSFFIPLIVEKHLPAWRAIETSRKSITHHWFKILGLFLVMLFIILVSALPIGIGLIWTLPMSNNVIGILYRTMFGVEKTSTAP